MTILGTGTIRNVKETGAIRKPVTHSPQPKTLLHKFNDLNLQEGRPQLALNQVLDRILENYLSENAVDATLAQEIQAFQIYLRQASLGNWLRFTFTSALPLEISQLFSHVATREEKLVKSGSPLVIDCDNIIAMNGRSAKSIYEQACRLERALYNREVAEIHVPYANARLNAWLDLLYDKFAKLVINANSFGDLKIQLEEIDITLCQDLYKTEFVKNDLMDHLNFLDENHFFEDFYQYSAQQSTSHHNDDDDNDDTMNEVNESHLAEQADFVDQFYFAMKESEQMTGTLQKLLDAFIVGIPEKAYQPCNAMKHQLIADPDNTVMNVVEKLDAFSNENWDPFEGSELLHELNDLLDEDQDELVNWEAVTVEQRPATPIPLPPLAAFQVFCFKYTLQDPTIDPAELLEEVQEQPKAERPFTPAPVCDALADHVEAPISRSRSKSF